MSKINLTKKFLTIPIEALEKGKIMGIRTMDWNDREGKHDKHGIYREHVKGEEAPFTGLQLSPSTPVSSGHLPSTDSVSPHLNGVGLGPEIFASYYRSKIGKGEMTHGLERKCNLEYRFFDPSNEKSSGVKGFGFGPNPIKPQRISFHLFGCEISTLKSNRWHKYSEKRIERFLWDSLDHHLIIKTLEEEIDFDATQFEPEEIKNLQESLEALVKINNFERFIKDEMDFLKGEFKDYKKISSIQDCDNLLFFFNPIFREIWEDELNSTYQNFYA